MKPVKECVAIRYLDGLLLFSKTLISVILAV